MADEKYQYRVTLDKALNPMSVQKILRDAGLLDDFSWQDVGVFYDPQNVKMQIKLVPRDEKAFFKWELKGGVDGVAKCLEKHTYDWY
jgi:hypothetical protein